MFCRCSLIINIRLCHNYIFKMNNVGKNFSNGNSASENIYHPENVLIVKSQDTPYGVMVLNRPIHFPVDFFLPLWNKASVRVTVDGGTNRWLSYLETNQIDSANASEVDIVCGDFDSINQNILQKFKSNCRVKNCFQVVHTPDQNETDFTKAIKQCHIFCRDKNIQLESLLVICETSGRLDQIMSIINTLYLCKLNKLMQARVYVISSDSISWLLNKGASKIVVPDVLLQHKKDSWCALMPVGSSAIVSTTGLRWNMNNAKMEFGGLVSTSNQYGNENIVDVVSDSYLLWSMSIIPLLTTLYGLVYEE